jgi:hypothetical protein
MPYEYVLQQCAGMYFKPSSATSQDLEVIGGFFPATNFAEAQ